MNVHAVGVSAAHRPSPHRPAASSSEVPASVETVSSAPVAEAGAAPTDSAPLVPPQPPSPDDVASQQESAGVRVPPGLARKAVTDANGDGRVDGRDVAFAKHGPDHPGRGFQPEHVGGTVPDAPDPVVDAPVDETDPLAATPSDPVDPVVVETTPDDPAAGGATA